MTGDDQWYEAAFVVGITNALNVVADGLAPTLPPLDAAAAGPEAAAVFAEARAFYGAADVPAPLAVVARDPAYLADLWGAVKRAFSERRLTRRHKTALAFAVSLTTRSTFGTAFHLADLRRLGVSESGVMEIVGVTQMFSSYTKIADTLQLTSDMADIAPADPSGVPDAGAG
ncbi:MAG TPA: carboxymuconolactone decarboxylase family protein [Methylomirabilota bacterium]|jgi:alkylhydroperoxidase family enzyme|nr:carboxymuconolactone decarboxylase family protein [Methylomirabilota bacterium]